MGGSRELIKTVAFAAVEIDDLHTGLDIWWAGCIRFLYPDIKVLVQGFVLALLSVSECVVLPNERANDMCV